MPASVHDRVTSVAPASARAAVARAALTHWAIGERQLAHAGLRA
jgi:hypothetical protein